MSSQTHETEHKAASPQLRRWALQAALGSTFIALMAGGIFMFHARAGSEPSVAANPPVTVTVTEAGRVSSYEIADTFSGRLEAGQETSLAFELGGLVTSVFVEEGDTVDVGDIIAEIDTAKLRVERQRLTASRAEMRARLALAEATLKRQQTLTKKGWQTEQRFDEARYAVAETTAAIKRIDAEIRAVDVDLAKSVVVAPYAGRIAARHLDEGAIVGAGTAVVDLLETDVIQARIGLTAETAGALETGQLVELVTGGGTASATVTSVRPDLTGSTRTVAALFTLTGPVPAAIGDTVTLTLPRHIGKAGVWLPRAALSEGRKGLWSVLTVREQDGASVVARETVQVLHTSGGQTFVQGTLPNPARIIVKGRNRVVPGQTVNTQTVTAQAVTTRTGG